MLRRPSDNESCAVCIEHTITPCRCEDDPSKTHLQYIYDRNRAKMHDLSDEAFSDWLRDYALNRLLAPWRDQRNKRLGLKAERTYQSRNTKLKDALDKFCPVGKGNLRCMRPSGHEGDHRF